MMYPETTHAHLIHVVLEDDSRLERHAFVVSFNASTSDK
jgi:hypothetical protein